MKNKNGMGKLRKKIMLSFLAVTFFATVISNNIEYLANIQLERLDKSSKAAMIFTFLWLMSDIIIYVTSAFIFYLMTRKAVRKESERQVKEKDLTYAAIVHDLKTPMTSVQGFAKALSDGKVRPEEQQEIFDIIYRKSISMNDMVNTLFEYSKLGTSGYKPVMEQVDLCAVVRDIIAENYCDIEEHKIDLDIDIPDETVTISADKKELKRAVSNLIVNVYKHNPDGIKARISVAKDGGKALVRIEDSGSPLPEGLDIFEPFVTENTARTIDHGTGLGLAITKRIIERHKGKICTVSGSNGFTKAFVITFRI